jgi:hypothetical protein
MNNQGIPANGVVENKIIEIGGTYTITQEVTFSNCIFKMRGDARINISPSGGGLGFTKVNFQGCSFFGCGEMWQGIFVDASGVNNTLQFFFWGNHLEDAYIGLSLDENNAAYSIADSDFRNNYIAISNLRQNGATLNASIVRNSFWQSADLALRTGSLTNPALMPEHPLAISGIVYIRVATSIGATPASGGGIATTENVFTCLLNGIISNESAASSINNTFNSMTQFGISLTEGNMDVLSCRFTGGGWNGIISNGASLRAVGNTFSGNWLEGIHSWNNLNSESVRIHSCQFNIAFANWRYGIYLDRTQANSEVTCSIILNHFEITSSPPGGVGGGLDAIHIADAVAADGTTKVLQNTMNINSASGGVIGILFQLGNSDKFEATENTIHFGMNSANGNFGIFLKSAFGQNLSTGHYMAFNDISGVGENSLQCCFHSDRVQAVEYCENTVDNSEWGIHFLNSNNVILRENRINVHNVGLRIGGGFDPRIGEQKSRGNQWPLDPNASAQFAAQVTSSGNPMFSRITVNPALEGSMLPWLPPNNKIDPTPTNLIPWFVPDLDPLDYCGALPREIPTIALTPYEKEVVLGTSTLTGVALWDLQREVYAKLLIYPQLRPNGSPEATFFNGLANTTISFFGQTDQQIRYALSLSSADQQAFLACQSAIAQGFDSLMVLDQNMNYTSPNNLTAVWFAQRAVWLAQIATNNNSERTLENTRNQQVGTALQNTLTFNAGIVTGTPYESARKLVNELRIRRLLRQQLSQPLYQQVIATSQLDPNIAGLGAGDAAIFLMPCDRQQFQEENHGAQNRDMLESKQTSNTLSEALLVSPNPTPGFVTITIPGAHEAGVLCLYNLQGQQIRMQPVALSDKTLQLDLSQVQNGMYWVLFQTEDGGIKCSAKIVISH